jgi:putative SOS response-associated peptidase YedK
MCGRFTQQRPSSELAKIFDAEDLATSDGGRFNVAPTNEALVVVQREADGVAQRAVVRYRWGLIPPWSDDPRIASKTFNARAETVTTSPMFRDAFRKRRCLVPVDGFFEWRREGTKRHPTRIIDPSGAPLALAGLWTGRQDPESGEWRRTFTVVTTRPNDFMASIHDRMPVIIPPAGWAAWLDAAGADPAEVRAMLEPREDLALDAYEVSDLVNNVRNDGPELILPAGSEPGHTVPRETLF